MRTRSIVIIVLSALLGISIIVLACNGIGGVIVGSSQLETREFDFEDFTNVEVGSTFKANISQSESYHISITASQNLFDYMVVTNDNGTLRIKLESSHTYRSVTAEVQITLPDLHSLNLSGASRGEVSGFRSLNELNLTASGASRMNITDMEAGDTLFTVSGASTVIGTITVVTADFNISGGSTVELTGSANEIDVQGSGGTSLRLEDFPTSKAMFNLSGGSEAITDVSDELDIILSGGSRLVYSGNPNLGSMNVSGGSSLHHQ